MAHGKIKADQIEHSTAGSLETQNLIHGTAKVLVTFDPSAIRRSHNVSSLTDDNPGEFRINVTSALKDLHSIILSGQGENATANTTSNTNEEQSTTQYKHLHFENGSATDCTDMNNAAFGDILA
tara:strand:- start:53 stop:424 length:372 start_codon:yes stop_codon:yes gene_type:complete